MEALIIAVRVLIGVCFLAGIVYVNVWCHRHPMTPEEQAEHDAEMQIW